MIPEIITACLLVGWLVLLRVTYINGIISDWNYNLSILINHYRLNKHHSHAMLNYYEKRILKPYKYYHKLRVWNTRVIIRDPFLIDEVQMIINQRFSKT
jgi:hypothetical protein